MPLWLRGAIALVAAGLMFSAGWSVHSWKVGAAETKTVIRYVRVAAAQGAVNTQVAATTAAATERVVWRIRTIRERIPVYVTVQADARCIVPRGFVRLHDLAAQGLDPGLPGGPAADADADSGLALSAVADTVAGNYGTAHLLEERVKAWEAWYDGQKAAWATK